MIDNATFEVVEILGHRALLVDDPGFKFSDCPKGLHAYDAREDEAGEPCSLSPNRIVVNWFGTFLTRDDLGLKDEIVLESECDLGDELGPEETAELIRAGYIVPGADDGCSDYVSRDGKWYRAYWYAKEFTRLGGRELTIAEFLEGADSGF